MNLELTLRRWKYLPDRTIGKLTAGDIWQCYTLEDKVREVANRPVSEWKIKGETAIPMGRYRVTLEHSNRFGKDTITLHDVDGFTAIRMHGGNGPDNTEGCPLVGRDYDENTNRISNCAPALAELKQIVREWLADGDEVWITIS